MAGRPRAGLVADDFRSDTVTLPTPAMMAAIAAAPLGDSARGDDPTVNELERLAARSDRQGRRAVPAVRHDGQPRRR